MPEVKAAEAITVEATLISQIPPCRKNLEGVYSFGLRLPPRPQKPWRRRKSARLSWVTASKFPAILKAVGFPEPH